jgi:hypothetical protein
MASRHSLVTIKRLADLAPKTVAVVLMMLGTIFLMAVVLELTIVPFLPYRG